MAARVRKRRVWRVGLTILKVVWMGMGMKIGMGWRTVVCGGGVVGEGTVVRLTYIWMNGEMSSSGQYGKTTHDGCMLAEGKIMDGSKCA